MQIKEDILEIISKSRPIRQFIDQSFRSKIILSLKELNQRKYAVFSKIIKSETIKNYQFNYSSIRIHLSKLKILYRYILDKILII